MKKLKFRLNKFVCGVLVIVFWVISLYATYSFTIQRVKDMAYVDKTVLKQTVTLTNVNENPLGNINQIPKYITSFENICCIGDSLTYGVSNTDNGDILSPSFGYPTIMARLTGCNVLNYGLPGYRANKGDDSSWMRKADQNGWLTSNDKCNLYIIALGTNDMGIGFSGDVATDIDLNNPSNNANTSVGGYAEIIQRILSIQPRAKIFCVTIPISRDDQIPSDSGYTYLDRINANNKIRTIANMFGCYIIDLEKYAEADNEEVTFFKDIYKNGSHNNALGYNLRARQYIAYIDWIIENNITDFQDIQFIGTDYTYTD